MSCQTCHGEGVVFGPRRDPQTEETCPDCWGDPLLYLGSDAAPCMHCDAGKVPLPWGDGTTDCYHCDGSGWRPKEKK